MLAPVKELRILAANAYPIRPWLMIFCLNLKICYSELNLLCCVEVENCNTSGIHQLYYHLTFFK